MVREMDTKNLDDYKDDIRERLDNESGAVVNESAVNKELVVDLIAQLGLVSDRTVYKSQKRYLP